MDDRQAFGQLERAASLLQDRLDCQQALAATLDGQLRSHSSADYAWWSSPLATRRTNPLPDALLDQFDAAPHRCLMGVFAPIARAWFAVDTRLFLWDYRIGTELASFDELDELICAVALACPTPGLFVADIHHILVIATPLRVSIVGLALSPPADLALYLTGLSVPTDGILFTAIHSHHPSGRIFLLGSSDSHAAASHGNELYELEYRADEGWFRKRCSLINHSRGGSATSTLSSLLPTWFSPLTIAAIVLLAVDHERHLVYALTKSGAIRMLSLGSGGKDAPSELASVSNVLRDALGMCPSAGPLLDPRTFEINGLHVISKLEGGKVALLLTTTLGLRLYFSHARRPYGYAYPAATPSSSSLDDDARPPALWLCHVRLPPRNPPAQQQNGPSQLSLTPSYLPPRPESEEPVASDIDMPPIPSPLNLTCTHYTSPGGFFLAAHGSDPDRNTLLVTAPDLGQLLSVNRTAAPSSHSSTAQAPPQVQAMSEIASTIPIEGSVWAIAHLSNPVQGVSPLIELAGSRLEWLVLSNMGITVLTSQRPVDILAGLLESMPGRDQDLALFWEKFGRDQTCAMCVCIAVTELISSSYTQDESAKSRGLLTSNTPHWGSAASSHAKKLLFESSGRPEIVTGQSSSIAYGAASSIPGVDDGRRMVFSGKHEAVALYLSWLVRPIWTQKVAVPSSQDPTLLVSNVPEALLMKVQKELDGLRTFMDNEAVLLTAMPDMRATGRTDPAVLSLEQSSILAIRALLTQAIEALSFVLLLMDYKFGDIMKACPEDVKGTLAGLTYREFITTKAGRDCARELVKTLINLQIGMACSVDAISETLQQRCGTFCTSDDVLLYKAIEALNRAKETSNEHEQRESATEALRLFKKGAKHISIQLLQHACNQFLETCFLDGIVELGLSCAKAWDTNGQALGFWKNGKPSGDPRSSVWDLVDGCYREVVQALERFEPSGKMTSEDAAAIRDHAVQLALSSDDELFHYHYYDYLLTQNLTIQLLDTGTKFLEGYLKAVPVTLVKADLLWQHYARQSAFFEAAKILGNLAVDEGLPLSLPRRIEYLSLAVSNAKSSPHLTSNSANGDAFAFLTDIEEKLDVAQVQVEVLQNVIDLDNEVEGKKDVLEVLQRRLLTISELYAQVVQPFGLLDATLLIFHVSDHRDEALTETVWKAIIERAHMGRPGGGVKGPEAVAGKVAELGRKFYPSDIAFNLPMVVSVVGKYAFENPLPGRIRWVGPMFKEAGVPWQSIWESMDELFITKVPPWHVNSTLAFLAYELTGVVEGWLEETDAVTTATAGSDGYGFPAARLLDVIERYANTLTTTTGILGSNISKDKDNIGNEYLNAAKKLDLMKIKIRERF